MAVYRYLAYDLVANTPIGELPLAAVGFNTSLNRIGQFKGRIPVMSDPGVVASQINTQVIPGRTALYVDRDGALVWGGIIWNSNYARSSDSWELSAQTFMSYFARRRLRVTKNYQNQEQLYIAQDLINYAQGIKGGNIGVTIPSTPSSFVNLNVIYNAFERRNIADEINTLSQSSTGFDYAIDVSYDSSGNPQKVYNLSYPRRGLRSWESGLVFESPGNVTDYNLPNDASITAFTVDVTGANNSAINGSPLVASSSITSYTDAGWPLLEDVIASKGVNDPNVLANLAQSKANSLGQPQILPSVTVDPGLDPILGTYKEGDEARFRLNGPMYSGTLDTYYRIIDIAVTPQEGGQHESVQLTLGPTLGY